MSESVSPKSRAEYFVVVSAQFDNIGDVVLRRRMLARIKREALLHVHVGNAPPSYIEALDIGAGHRIYTSLGSWLAECLKAASVRDAHLLLPVGELSATPRGVLRHLCIALPGTIGRMRHRRVLRIGSGVRNTEGKLWPVLRLLAKVPTVTVWRDITSPSFMGVGSYGPDWGFDSKLSVENGEGERRNREFLAITMRYDRPFPSEDWFDAVRTVADKQGWTLAVLSQVRRDNQRNAGIAEQLEAEFYPWSDVSHLEQESVVREIYRRSHAVISDRLHGLVIGLVEGAVPLGVINGSDAKINRHFSAAGIDGISFEANDRTSEDLVEVMRGVLARKHEIFAAAEAAAARVRVLDQVLVGERLPDDVGCIDA